MPSLSLRDIPEPLHEWLRERAEANDRSVNGEILQILDRARSADSEEKDRKARMVALRARYLAGLETPIDELVAMIRSDRER